VKQPHLSARRALLIPAVALLCGTAMPASQNDVALARQLAEEIIAVCPLAAPTDEAARDRSADTLAQSTLLRQALADPFYWGGQRTPTSYRPAQSNLTLFNPFLWRRLYLSLFMFPGTYTIQQVDKLTLLHLPCRFRNSLDPGAYPYPFWHSAKKWDNYQRAAEVLLVIENGQVIAGYRSARMDPGNKANVRVWDGQWEWTDRQGREMPYAALYQYLFSTANPHVSRLAAAYRALAEAARQQSCVVCHSPANPAAMNPLRLLNLPNQALSVRHQIVAVLEDNRMPPIGIEDNGERKKLLALAQEFAAIGDQALDYEREFKPR
jgi:mono/diheme cytochrome c family protein